ncbi:MAG: glycoside hydrolase family 38 N-terminal domain-containing protein, partial [Thermoguttaceae bacterium]
MKSCTLLSIVAAMTITSATAAAAEPAPSSSPEPRLTVVNASSHCDWCWGHTRLWHEDRYAEILRQVLGLMRTHPNYVWLLETANEELAPFLERAGRESPELVAEFWQRVREERIEIIGAVSNPRLTEVYPETMVRNLVLGRQYFERHAPGAPLEVYNSIDLMCGPSQMPQVLAKSGYRYFMFSRPVGPQAVFWRRGLDGTRMLTAKCFYGYDKMGTYGEPLPGFLPVSVWREAIGADDVLPDPKLPQEAAGWDPKKKVLSTNRRYFEEVEKCGDPITELEGPLDSLECYVEAGLHGGRSLYMQNNQDEDLLLALEKAQVIALGTGQAIDAGAADRLWHDVLACTGHAIQWAWTVDYQERLAFARHRRTRIEQALDETLSALAARTGFRPGLGSPLVVFNFQAWPVTGPAEFAIEGDPAGLVLRNGEGREVPLQPTWPGQAGEPRAAFIAQSVPACGFRTFYLGRAAATSQAMLGPGSGPVENDAFRAEMRADGTLEIFDKARQTALGSAEPGGPGDVVFYDAPPPRDWEMSGPLGPMHRWTTATDQQQQVQGPVFAALRARGTYGGHAAVREL